MGTVHYQTQGAGSALVFLHGFCEDSTIWSEFVSPFAAQNQIITIDLPGFGQSEPTDTPTITHFSDVVKDILDQLHIQKCVLIGHSMGGYVALAFAKKYPERLTGLCLFHSHPFEDTPLKKENRQKTIAFIETNGTLPFLKQLLPSLFANKNVVLHQNLIKKLIEKAATYPQKGIIGGLRAMINRPDCAEVLQQLNVPLLLLIGQQDNAVSYSDSLKMCSLAPVAMIEIFEHAGHVAMFEAKEQAQVAIHKFLATFTL
jgi:pimeloyl-ACP methyl ester carboxylesterase